jgi:RNA polymerase sigma factor for flagellar operon FliA
LSIGAPVPVEHAEESFVGAAAGLSAEGVGADAVDEAVQANPHDAVEQVELFALIGVMLEKLPDRERQLIRRHYFEQCEFRVIAGELAVTPGRVSQLHAQALSRIRELLQPRGEPQGSA